MVATAQAEQNPAYRPTGILRRSAPREAYLDVDDVAARLKCREEANTRLSGKFSRGRCKNNFPANIAVFVAQTD